MELPKTTKRVSANTSEKYDRAIASRTEESVAWYAEHPDRIPQRLEALEREWDIERSLEANAASLAVAGVLLGATVDRRFFAIPGVVGAFLLQHALQGWCPPVPLLRRLGVRTQSEIDEERYALKALRGDFERVPQEAGRDGHGARTALAAARA